MQDIFRFGPSSLINGRASLNFPIKDRIMFWMSDSRYISQSPINIEFTLGFPGRITGRKEGLWMCVWAVWLRKRRDDVELKCLRTNTTVIIVTSSSTTRRHLARGISREFHINVPRSNGSILSKVRMHFFHFLALRTCIVLLSYLNNSFIL
jgi:hypothetical protein